MKRERNISAILLGAGRSQRLGTDKLSLAWGRRSVLEHCFKTILESNVHACIVVLSARNKWTRNLFQGPNVKVVINPYSRKGMSTSIRRGVIAVPSKSDGILVALGDQPFLKTRTINVLIRAFGQAMGGIIIPSFFGRRGHPVIFHSKYKKELLKLKGDVGARSIIKRHPEDVRVVPVKSAGVVKDLDTWEDYKHTTRRARTNSQLR